MMQYELWWNEEDYSYTCVPADSKQRSWLTVGAELKATFEADSPEDAFKLRDKFMKRIRMNERIKELAEQAGFGSAWFEESTPGYPALPKEGMLKEFAGLIAQECMSLMNTKEEYYSKTDAYETNEYYVRCQAKREAFEDAAWIIKEHFGVEG